MSADTNDLIDSLSKDLQPVKPLPRAWVRAAVLSLWAVALGFLLLHFVHGPAREDLAAMLRRNIYLSQAGAMIVAGILSAYAAFRLSVPDTRIRPAVAACLAVPTLVWASLILGELLASRAVMPEAAPSCFIGLTLAMSLPLVLAVVMIMRSAPVWNGLAGYALVLSTGSFGALVMRFTCPNDSPGHLLVWHFLPVMAFALAGIALGKILLRMHAGKK